jgi:1,2-diacylglycerol 3-alpha-glucosyltransferase
MKILVVGRYFYPKPGGGETFLYKMFASLAERGHEVYVVTSCLEDTPKHEKSDGLYIYRPYPGGNSWLNALLFSMYLVPYLGKFIQKKPVDIIFNIAYSCTFSVRYVARKARIPLVTHVGYFFGRAWFHLVNPLLASINLLLPVISIRFGGHDTICCPSSEVSERLQAYSKAKVEAIPNGLDIAEIESVEESPSGKNIRLVLGARDDEQLLLFVGRLSAEKNVDGLLQIISEKNIKSRLVIVGDGPERDKLEKLTNKLNLKQRVVFLGHRPHKEALGIMKACDILILPSKTEVFPMVVLEALALGTPVIATRVGGISEVKSPNLYLIDKLLEITQLLPVVKPVNNRNIIEDYSLDKICSRYEDMFKRAIRSYG